VHEAKHVYNNSHIRTQHNGFGHVSFEVICLAMDAAVEYNCKAAGTSPTTSFYWKLYIHFKAVGAAYKEGN
jgi:hypothetical protein